MEENSLSPEVEAQEQEATGLQLSNFPAIDPVLWHEVRMTNILNISSPLTLVVGGVVVSGHLISERKYAATMGRMRAESTRFINDDGSAMTQEEETRQREQFSESFALFARSQEEYQNDPEAHYFIHMEDVVIPQGGVPVRTPLWRCRLTEVSGFTFASMDGINSRGGAPIR